MGLGNLNPGCGCGCQIRVPITDSCRLAGRFWQPSRVTLTCQSFGGSAPSACASGAGICSQPMKFNPAIVATQIPAYDHPDFTCVYGTPSFADYVTGISTTTNPINECWGMWPIWTSGGCVIGFSNFYRLGTSLNVWGYPYVAGGSVTFGYSPATNVGFLNVQVFASASLFAGQFYLGNTLPCSVQPKQSTSPGETGSNWTTLDPSVTLGGAVEVGGPPIRTSRYQIRYAAAYSTPGAPGTLPPWCSAAHRYYQIYSESNYTIATNDPIYGSKRSFELWTPSPAIDELGLTLSANISVQTAV